MEGFKDKIHMIISINEVKFFGKNPACFHAGSPCDITGRYKTLHNNVYV